MTAHNTPSLPHWDMSVVFPSLESSEFVAAFRQYAQDVDDLVALFDTKGIGARESAPLDEVTVQTFETIIARLNAILETSQTMRSYVTGFTSTDSRDAVAQARQSELEQIGVQLAKLNTRLTAWIGSLDVERLIARSPVAADHAYLLQRAAVEAQHLMSPAEEALAAEFSLTSGRAWQKLWNNVSSQVMAVMERDGKAVELPITVVRNLGTNPDREVRRQAHEAELAAWQRVAVPLAAAMNGVKGETNLLTRRRKWPSPLDAALFNNGIDRQTLDAMMGTTQDAFPLFRRYLRAKARALGLPALAWYDRLAPVGKSATHWEFDRAAAFIIAQFGTYSPRLQALAERAFAEHWIDAEPRTGKRGGGFCMPLRRDESRILCNYTAHLGSVGTLAHELGHAYHNVCRSIRTPLQRATPMVLAETASTFCETIVTAAALKEADREEQIAILDDGLMGATGVTVDITARFQFEEAVLAKRAQRELSPDELCALMVAAQKDTYGDGLDPSVLHPYEWAAKTHYYSVERSFYNFPYMFGLLFGLGLYARYQTDPQRFKASYDDLLSSTGMADAATLAARFGLDIRSRTFWQDSLDVIAADVARFETLVGTAS